MVIIRHEVKEKKRPGGKALLEVPGYLFQALVTNQTGLKHAPIALWRDFNERAGCECVIKELDAGFALPKLILLKFWATEAALSLAVMSYNLVVLFEQKLGWQDKRVTVGTLRYWLFVTAGELGSHAGEKHAEVRRAQKPPALVGAAVGENIESLPQLQCSRPSPALCLRLSHPKHHRS